LKSANEATAVAERISAIFQNPFRIAEREVFSAVTVGIAVSKGTYAQPISLLRDADVALQRAKQNGLNYAIFDVEMHNRAVARLELENQLRQALNEREMSVFYQPVVTLASGRVYGFEGLMRWKHPNGRIWAPQQFLAVAEETGLIVPIGYQVLEDACSQLAAWHREFPDENALAVGLNLSAKQLGHPSLVETVKRILSAHGLEGCHLWFEVTEGVLQSNLTSAQRTLNELSELGIQICLDDFGAAGSTLQYLDQLPINRLKLDRSYVARMGASGENVEIVRSIVSLAHVLGLDVVAKGVETSFQIAQVKGLRGKLGQGYYFSKPLEGTAVSALLNADRAQLGDTSGLTELVDETTTG
jgi:EAL domain-containing protein (putative c-di-GMP-specific phosphodiesterase class I)